MRIVFGNPLGITAVVMSWILASSVHAEAAPEGTDPSAQNGSTQEAAKAERNDDPMNGIGFGLKAGYLYYGASDYKNAFGTQESALARGEPTLNFELYLGDGFGMALDTEMYLAFSDKSLSVVGGYLGPAFRFHIKRMYFSVGVGLRIGYVTADVFGLSSPVEKGLDLYGRIPITLTYYVTDWLGIVAEFGFGVGGTGVKLEPSSTDPLTTAQDYQFGTAGTLDFTLGLRLP